MDIESRLSALEKTMRELQSQRMGQINIIPKAVKQRHLEAYIIFSGLDANKPTDAKNDHRKAFYATDTHKLYITDGSTYKSVTLS